MADLRVVITAHPIGGLKPEQVRARAGSMIDAVVGAATG